MSATRIVGCGVLLAGLASALPAVSRAAVIFNVPPDLSAAQNGQNPYNTAATPLGFAAQEFTLTGPATITSVDFNSIVLGTGAFGTAANFQFLNANGPGGAPGTLVTSGFDEPLTHTAGPTGVHFATTNYTFDITPLTLAAGSYFVGIQEVTTNSSDFLSKGTAATGAAQSTDGGVTYTISNGFDGLPSVSVSLAGTVAPVPEPTALAVLGTGLLGLGIVCRRRG